MKTPASEVMRKRIIAVEIVPLGETVLLFTTISICAYNFIYELNL